VAARQTRLTPGATLVASAALAALALLAGAARVPAAAQPAAHAGPRRIVSLIPATTEMLFAIGAGDRLVGVSSYDRFPPEVDRIARVGGLINPDTERILALRPDLVVVYATQDELKQRLERSAIPCYIYEHRTLADVMATVRALGERVGLPDQAEQLASNMERELERLRAAVSARARPLTLLVFGRDPGSLRGMFATGGYGFLADLLDVAGGRNLFADVDRQSVQVSTEVVLARRPEVIVELRYGDAAPAADLAATLAPWRALASVPAVKSGRIHVLAGDEFVVPGPRIVRAAERLAATLHPSP
jgi:iron complex transport system substrate-binding protein